MTDYESLKVTELKSLLKERGVSATGLTKKAQYIQALQDDDTSKAQNTADTEETNQAAIEDTKTDVDTAARTDLEQPTATDNEDTKDSTSAQPADAVTSDTEAVPEEQAASTTETKENMEETSQERKRKREDVIEDDLAPEEKKPRQEMGGMDVESLPNVPQNTNDEASTADQDDAEEETTLDLPNAEESLGRTNKGLLDEEMDDVDDERTVAATLDTGPPSEHRPTLCLYIRGLMRPLQAQAFRDHLETLVDGSIERLHLDFMKTHAFVICRDQAAASTIRSKLHNRVWPEETQRRPLWIDYIPENEVLRWIREETDAGREARFSVTYNDGVARLVNSSNGSDMQRPPPPDNNEAGKGVPGAPLGPRGDRRPAQQRPVQDDRTARAPQSASFNKLDQYFKFTTARPKIYFQPVTKEIADRRFDEVNRETSRDWDRGRAWNRTEKLAPIDQLRRYTFEDDRVVDGGLDFGGFGRRQGAGGSGGVNSHPHRGGGFRGRYRGGGRY